MPLSYSSYDQVKNNLKAAFWPWSELSSLEITQSHTLLSNIPLSLSLTSPSELDFQIMYYHPALWHQKLVV